LAAARAGEVHGRLRGNGACPSGRGGDGTATRPFSQLAQAEAASAAGDRIDVSAKSAREILPGSITLKPNQKLIGLSSSGRAPRYESERPRLTSSVVDGAVYNMPYNNGNHRPTTAIVMLARGVEVSGIHFVDTKGPALLAGDRDISGTRILGNTLGQRLSRPGRPRLFHPLGGHQPSDDDYSRLERQQHRATACRTCGRSPQGVKRGSEKRVTQMTRASYSVAAVLSRDVRTRLLAS
jgi:hypothetical protein